MTKIVALLDACVLYPAPLRDLLLNIAQQKLFSPRWSAIIQEEWTRNLLVNRPDLSKERLNRTVNLMNTAFPEADVANFEHLINKVHLPDTNDRHVVAAALHTEAQLIITFNTKDFPENSLHDFPIKIQQPDEFVSDLFVINKEAIQQAFDKQLNRLKNPPLTKDELKQMLEKCGLKKSAQLF